MKKSFPKKYSFFPQTWLLPTDWYDLKTTQDRHNKNRCKAMIVKPEASCQGK